MPRYKLVEPFWNKVVFRTKSEQFLGARMVVQSNASVRSGWYKRAPIAVLRQAEFYPPRQAAAPHYTRYFLSLVYCCSCTVEAINLKVA